MTRSKLKIFLWIWSLFVLSAVLITSSRMHAQGQQFVPDELLLKFRAGTPSSKVDEAINQVGATILERSIGDPDLYRVRVSAGTNLDNAIRRFMQNPDVVRATRNPVEHLPQVEQQFVPDELLVKFRYRAPRSTVDQANIRLGATIREQSIGDPDLYWVKLQPGTNLDDAIRQYMQNSDVVRATKNLRIFLHETIPLDPGFSQQWSLKNTGTPRADIRATFAWDIRTGDPNFVIAVIDSGVDYTHPDLAANTCQRTDPCHGWNFIDGNDDPMDFDGHGTHVAGIIAAVGNNGIGIAGVMWRAKIMPLKAIPSFSLFPAIQAIDYSWQHGAKISNNSWGCKDASNRDIFLCNDTGLRDAIKRADVAGQLFVASAGNGDQVDGIDVDGGMFEQTNCLSNPSTYPCNIIGVAASDRVADLRDGQDSRARFSNYGQKTIHIGAPGVGILSTWPGGGYQTDNGTSQAAPHVTGTAGLIWSQNPSYSHRNVKESVLLAHRPVVAFHNAILGTPFRVSIYPGITNANDGIRAFGDTFDDTQSGLRFFSQGGTGQRWAVAQNGSARCDLFVTTESPGTFGTIKQTVNVQYFDQAGVPGSNWSFASYKLSYPPDGQPQELKLRIVQADSSRRGRIAVGFIGQTGVTNLNCPQTGLNYDQHLFRASIVGGVNLDDLTPFWTTDPEYFEQTYPPVTSIQNSPGLTISMKFTLQNFTLTLLRPDNGAQLFTATAAYPANFTWTGTHAPAIAYYGMTAGTSASFLVRDIVSIRPSGT